ncbi:PREDICTED: uncharacterized protein LOC109329166 isoform X3 [Lupinus angustifolius]|uniref:uncharacterized protein LOC109329166 isoform X3 n=1 Tax=Lupinus angustifolius TaxID=3871 RepID=UPI00092E49BA|nr:PREDICTED: uncharacterized protein LOC109329166 isoform X3 [Lupinus angustifolius]
MTQLLLLSKKDGTDSGDIDLPLCLSCMRGLGMRLQRSKGSQCPQMRGFTVLMMMENIRTMDRAIEAKGIVSIASNHNILMVMAQGNKWNDYQRHHQHFFR